MKAYLARAMTGRVKKEVVVEAMAQKIFCEYLGIEVLDPVSEEGVVPSTELLMSSYEEMVKYWKRDKEMIREAHVVFDMTPNMKSEGVSHEIGYARYALYKPVIRVYLDGMVPPKSSIARFEDDYLAVSLPDAIQYSERMYGTRFKRFKWRLSMYARCWTKMFLYRTKEWFK